MEHDCANRVLSGFEKDSWNDWRTLESMMKSPDCPVCRIIVHLVAQHQGTEDPITYHKDGSIIQCKVLWDFRQPDSNQFSNRNSIKLVDYTTPKVQNIEVSLSPSYPGPKDPDSLTRGVYAPKVYYITFRNGLRELSTANPSDPIYQRRHSTNDGTIDPHFLASWIDSFRRNHESRWCYRNAEYEITGPPRGFKLIDVDAMKITEAPSNSIYVALSYVWGADYTWLKLNTTNERLLREEQSLSRMSDCIPRTIRDAITLLQQLGIKYLWVDSLCIIQEDLNDKLEQISTMHTIYERAYLVIAAAYGNNADAGLPGVEPHRFPRRVARRREYIHDKVRLLSCSTKLDDALSETEWNIRGWTYQESELSRMQLTFTASQAYLHCRCGMVVQENFALDAFHALEAHSSIPAALKRIQENRWRYGGTLWNEYRGFLRAYTGRKLSFPSDILNAFSAILKMLEKKWHTRFIFGLPESALAPALLWQDWGGEPFCRRDCEIQIRQGQSIVNCPVPSWSWAGWIGQVDLLLDLEDPDKNYCYETAALEVKWTFSDHHVLLAEGDPLRHTLIQATPQTAYFDVGKIESTFEHGDAHQILDAEKEVVGHIRIPSSPYWPIGKGGQRECKFIAISARPRTLFRVSGTDRIFNDENNPQMIVEVMLLSSRRNGIAFRVGIASIHWDDWMAANPVAKLVSLG